MHLFSPGGPWITLTIGIRYRKLVYGGPGGPDNIEVHLGPMGQIIQMSWFYWARKPSIQVLKACLCLRRQSLHFSSHIALCMHL